MSLGPVRRALLALAVGGFAIGTGEFVILGLLPNVASDLAVTIPQAGHLVSAYALGVVVGAPTLTIACVRLPRKAVLIALLIAFALGNLASALAPTFDWELLARFASGLPHGAFFGVGAVVAVNMVTTEPRQCGHGGDVHRPDRGQHRRRAADDPARPAHQLAPRVRAGRRDRRPGRGHRRDLRAGRSAASREAARSRSTGHMLRHEFGAFAKPQVWLTLAIAMLGGGGLFATFSYINPMMTHLAGYAPSSMTWLLVLFGLGMTVGNLLGARLADRALMPTMYGAFAAEIVVAAAFIVTSHSKIGAAITIPLLPGDVPGRPACAADPDHLAGGRRARTSPPRPSRPRSTWRTHSAPGSAASPSRPASATTRPTWSRSAS